MYTANGTVEKRSPNRLPDAPPNRQHPLDSSLNHRNGRLGKDSRDRNATVAQDGGLMVTRKGESIKAVRHTIRSSRSKLAVSSQPGHAQIFVKTQVQTDRRLDGPTPELTHIPVRHGRTRGMGGMSGGRLRRSVSKQGVS